MSGWPALRRYGARLVGYFIGDVGALNQIVHSWKFAGDADRRRFWEAVLADEVFIAFVTKLPAADPDPGQQAAARPPWGPQP